MSDIDLLLRNVFTSVNRKKKNKAGASESMSSLCHLGNRGFGSIMASAIRKDDAPHNEWDTPEGEVSDWAEKGNPSLRHSTSRPRNTRYLVYGAYAIITPKTWRREKEPSVGKRGKNM
jgi:hypothetical protein